MAHPRIGLALGGGFARGVAHGGVLKALARHGIPIHCITGVSAGSIVAAAFASGTEPDEIIRAGCSMRFRDRHDGRFSLHAFSAPMAGRAHSKERNARVDSLMNLTSQC
jgi:NTE family protein